MSSSLDEVIDEIDSLNAQDPNLILVDGTQVPKELHHGRVATKWLRVICKEPSDEQVIAARAHHLQRWVEPRSGYPDGRKGYLKWRTAQKKRHSQQIEELLDRHGFSDSFVTGVAQLVEKANLDSDEHAQNHEDALCLTFFELQLTEFASQRDPESAISILTKTLKKMSGEARDVAQGIDLPGELKAAVSEISERLDD